MAEEVPVPELYLIAVGAAIGGDQTAGAFTEEQTEFALLGVGLAKNKLGQLSSPPILFIKPILKLACC